MDLCDHCEEAIGCTCSQEERGVYAAVEGFAPKPGQGKQTTFSKAQRKNVMKSVSALKAQDEAMWGTLTGKRMSMTKCLLAVTAAASNFVGAVGQITTFADPGQCGGNVSDGMIHALNETVQREDPSVIYIHVPFMEDEDRSEGHAKLQCFAEEQMKVGKTCIIADTRHSERWESHGCAPARCKGDLAFVCNNKAMTEELLSWARSRDNGNPRCVEDLSEPQFADVLAGIAEAHHMDKCVDAAFVNTDEANAEEPENPLDGILTAEDREEIDVDQVNDDEQDLLDKIPLPGNPVSEQKRKAIWLSLPRRARIAIRRLHRNFRHLPKNALVQMLRASKVPKSFIDAAKAHRCDVCDSTKPPPRLNKTSRPKPYIFNHEVGVDVLEIKDAAGTFYDILNVVDYGTTFEQAFIVRAGENHGVPSSKSCLDAFVKGWTRPFGWPKFVAADRGTHNRGVFSQSCKRKEF